MVTTGVTGSDKFSEPDLVSLAQQPVALQDEARNIETRIAEIEEMQKSLPALEDELTMKREEILEMTEKVRAFLPQREPQ